MPLYEEKMISPLGVRFTQEHIRTTFRDERIVEDTIKEIEFEEVPGAEDFDVILRFPFPAIEIVRWRAHGDDEEVAEEYHWFTLDNRRLYCLQRAAVSCWPKRAAVAVEILYASPGSVRRKCDTTTFGRSVTIAHSIRDLPETRFDWVEEVGITVKGAQNRFSKEEVRALNAIMADDERETVQDLLSLPGESMSAIDRALAHLSPPTILAPPAAGQNQKSFGRSSTPSTMEPSEDSDDGSWQATPRQRGCTGGKTLDAKSTTSGCVALASCGGTYNECYAEEGVDEDYWNCVEWAIWEIQEQLRSPDNYGYVSLPHWNRDYAPQLGSLRGFLTNRSDLFTVIPGKGKSYRVEAVAQATSKPRARRAQANYGWQQRTSQWAY